MAFMQSCSFLGKNELSRPKPLRTPLAWFISYQLSYNLRAHLLRMDQLVSIHHQSIHHQVGITTFGVSDILAILDGDVPL